MCYNSKGNVFPLQFMIMTVLIYSLKWQVWREMGGGCDAQFLWNFHIEEIKKKIFKFQKNWTIGKFWRICCVLP